MSTPRAFPIREKSCQAPEPLSSCFLADSITKIKALIALTNPSETNKLGEAVTGQEISTPKGREQAKELLLSMLRPFTPSELRQFTEWHDSKTNDDTFPVDVKQRIVPFEL